MARDCGWGLRRDGREGDRAFVFSSKEFGRRAGLEGLHRRAGLLGDGVCRRRGRVFARRRLISVRRGRYLAVSGRQRSAAGAAIGACSTVISTISRAIYHCRVAPSPCVFWISRCTASAGRPCLSCSTYCAAMVLGVMPSNKMR